LDQVTRAELEGEIPSYAEHDDFLVKVPTLKELLCRSGFHHRWPLTPHSQLFKFAPEPEKPAVSHDDPCEITLVRSVMVKSPHYCRENQSDEEALKMMRELDLPCLPVLDSNLRVVGMVSMRDLMRSKEQKDPPQLGK
jgi:CBS domain-containing protein